MRMNFEHFPNYVPSIVLSPWICITSYDTTRKIISRLASTETKLQQEVIHLRSHDLKDLSQFWTWKPCFNSCGKHVYAPPHPGICTAGSHTLLCFSSKNWSSLMRGCFPSSLSGRALQSPFSTEASTPDLQRLERKAAPSHILGWPSATLKFLLKKTQGCKKKKKSTVPVNTWRQNLWIPASMRR